LKLNVYLLNLFGLKKIYFSLFFCAFTFGVWSQQGLLRKTVLVATDAPVVLDSLSVFWTSLKVYKKNQLVRNYEIDTASNALIFPKQYHGDTLEVWFRVFSMRLHGQFYNKDSLKFFNRNTEIENPFLITADLKREDLFGSSALEKSGSISRGINVGNAQDLSVNSTMNIQLSGEISDNLKILATLTDDNIPIQPDGTTNKLREFDQLFIQLYNDDFKVIAGDFWARTPKGYFMTYNKRAQGLTASYKVWQDEEKGNLKI
jgi:hypothetical protein